MFQIEYWFTNMLKYRIPKGCITGLRPEDGWLLTDIEGAAKLIRCYPFDHECLDNRGPWNISSKCYNKLLKVDKSIAGKENNWSSLLTVQYCCNGHIKCREKGLEGQESERALTCHWWTRRPPPHRIHSSRHTKHAPAECKDLRSNNAIRNANQKSTLYEINGAAAT